MMSRLELAIALRYLRSRRGSRLLSFITVIAIGGLVVGISALIVIIGVMNGLQNDLREKILVGSPDLRVHVYGDDLRLNGWPQILARVRRQDGVVAAAPFVTTQALMRGSSSYTDGANVMGILPVGDSGPPVTAIRDHAIEGDFRFVTADGKRRGAVVGKLLAERMNARVGTKLTMITSAGGVQNAVTGMYMPRLFEFEVTGVFSTAMFEYDDKYVFVDIDQAREMAGIGAAVTGLEVKTVNRDAASAVARAIEDTLGYPYYTRTWEQQNSSLFKALKLEKLGMSVILLLIIVVAALNIVGTLTMVVRDKTREIGILKAMGLRAASVRRIFMVQGLVIGVVGTGIGLVLGVATSVIVNRYRLITLDPQIYFIDHLPVHMQTLDVVLIALLGVGVATLATVFPALQASRLFPIEAIRSE